MFWSDVPGRKFGFPKRSSGRGSACLHSGITDLFLRYLGCALLKTRGLCFGGRLAIKSASYSTLTLDKDNEYMAGTTAGSELRDQTLVEMARQGDQDAF